ELGVEGRAGVEVEAQLALGEGDPEVPQQHPGPHRPGRVVLVADDQLHRRSLQRRRQVSRSRATYPDGVMPTTTRKTPITREDPRSSAQRRMGGANTHSGGLPCRLPLAIRCSCYALLKRRGKLSAPNGYGAPPCADVREVSNGSWLCENADVLRHRRMAFSSVKCSFLLARGSPLAAY